VGTSLSTPPLKNIIHLFPLHYKPPFHTLPPYTSAILFHFSIGYLSTKDGSKSKQLAISNGEEFVTAINGSSMTKIVIYILS